MTTIPVPTTAPAIPTTGGPAATQAPAAVFSLEELEALDRSAAPAPFTFAIDGHIITFPDPMGLSVTDSQRFMNALEGASSPADMIREWVGEEDAALLLDRVNMRALALLIQRASKHYAAFLGDAGEGTASTTA